MDYQLEQEWKGSLSSEDFHKLLDYAKANGYEMTEIDQVNHYFDTADFGLINHAMMLRIREKKQTFECTGKIARQLNSDEDGAASPNVTEEYTVKLSPEEAQSYIHETGKWNSSNDVYRILCERLGVDQLHLIYLGSLRTRRILIDLKNGMEPICLDKSKYLGIEDYELEWETDSLSQAHSHLKTIIEQLHIELDWHVSPKSARFFAALQKERDNR